ncbi:hypothetical protein [Enterococcus casseliflavus]|uniref:hypothetical protein n=1 Tax=Enterococcus casseliflavus TaxID=37734 RepID=UPI003017E1E1
MSYDKLFKYFKDVIEPILDTIEYKYPKENHTHIFESPSCVLKLHDIKTLFFNGVIGTYGLRGFNDLGEMTIEMTCGSFAIITFPKDTTMVKVYRANKVQSITFATVGDNTDNFTISPQLFNVQTSYQKLRNKISIL